MSLRSRALMMSSARAGIGMASIFAPSVSARITGYPAEHDNATARMIGRLFGVRELLLAWLVVDAVRRPEVLWARLARQASRPLRAELP